MNIQEWLEAGKPWNVILHGDCMDLMKHFNDKEINLSIVDPPYGININNNMGRRRGQKHSGHKKIKWDNETPEDNYFDELFRISHNQIIWGGNYFDLPLTGAWIFWDKLMPPEMSFSAGELAWMTFGNTLRKVTIQHSGIKNDGNKNKIHPTQKPVALYRWLLQNYAKPGDKIIDTHSGSGSLACACHLEKFDFLAIEKDEDYYKASCERLETLRSQGTLF
jgi:site-specific DNA-methyltransferase (adenine-specific)